MNFWSFNQASEFISLKKEIPEESKSLINRFIREHIDITKRALIVSLVLENWQKFEVLYLDSAFDEYTIYDTLILGWIRDWAERAQVVDELTLHKISDFINRLALVMFNSSSKLKIEKRELEKRIISKFKNSKIFESISRQIKTRSILVSTDNGSFFQFCHRSIWEFIIAKQIINAIESKGKGKYNKMVLARARNQPELYSSISKQFVFPLLKKQGRLNLLENFLLD